MPVYVLWVCYAAIAWQISSVKAAEPQVLPDTTGLEQYVLVDLNTADLSALCTLPGVGVTKVVALNGGSYGITANAITPGLILTQMAVDLGWANQEHNDIPIGRLGTPEDIANVAVFLGSYISDYVSGDIVKVNGGMYMG